MHTNNSFVSVIIPTYNRGPLIRNTIESVIQQSYQNYELIIIDDGSSDSSWKIIQEYAQKDTRIIAVKNEKNLKICATLNK